LEKLGRISLGDDDESDDTEERGGDQGQPCGPAPAEVRLGNETTTVDSVS